MELINYNRIFFLTIFSWVSVLALGQHTSDSISDNYSKWNYGLSVSKGSVIFFGKEVYNYEYNVQLFELHAIRELIVKDRWAAKLIISPQFNISEMREDKQFSQERTGFELGCNLGLAFYKNLGKHSIYLLAGLGPHYISESLDRQVKGFIFSDNFEIGLSMAINRSIMICPNFGFRHLSNASIRRPNNGINSFITGLAIIINTDARYR